MKLMSRGRRATMGGRRWGQVPNLKTTSLGVRVRGMEQGVLIMRELGGPSSRAWDTARWLFLGEARPVLQGNLAQSSSAAHTRRSTSCMGQSLRLSAA